MYLSAFVFFAGFGLGINEINLILAGFRSAIAKEHLILLLSTDNNCRCLLGPIPADLINE